MTAPKSRGVSRRKLTSADELGDFFGILVGGGEHDHRDDPPRCRRHDRVEARVEGNALYAE
jgi:hypothetical protein